MENDTDIVIVGGGHNGLVAAAYLAREGLSVTVLERSDAVGGAAVSAQAFEGVDARLSRYSYLVSLLPPKIIDDLGLDLTLARRRYSSYTPLPGANTGLLIDTGDASATRASFDAIGAPDDADLFGEFYRHSSTLTSRLWPTLTEPLLRRSEARALVDDERVWHHMIERPIGEIIEECVQSDLVRGVILTDALIGTFAGAHDPDLAQNICFLYHLIGGGTGDWDVPIGGMGAVTGALERAAREAGAEIVTGAEVTAIDPGPTTTTVHVVVDGGLRMLRATTTLVNVAPAELDRLLAAAPSQLPSAPSQATSSPSQAAPSPSQPPSSPSQPEGAQVKVNLMLSRLPRLLDDTVTPEAAFGGTFHINESYSQLQKAFEEAGAGRIPNPLPAEIYCHSLTDPSILSPQLQQAGVQTLTVFGLHVPHRLVTDHTNDDVRAQLQRAVLDSLNSVLAEPIEGCILNDANGRPCIETKTTLDLERALRMPGGNIFHGPLSWPFAENDEPLDTPAERWGVATAHPGILLCGSGSRRGGAVSGLGGHSAAMAVLEERARHRAASGIPD